MGVSAWPFLSQISKVKVFPISPWKTSDILCNEMRLYIRQSLNLWPIANLSHQLCVLLSLLCVCECLLNWAVWYLSPWTLDNKAFYCFQILENNINFLWDHFLDERHPLVELLLTPYTQSAVRPFFRSKITHKQVIWHLTRFESKGANLLIHTNRQKMNKKTSRLDLMASIHA